ncbi:MAG: hypothetical protein WKF58_09575 [Ilumatobacteraceae bacterium]
MEWETREANIEGAGEITQADLVRHALRFNPDWLIVGEVPRSTWSAAGDQLLPAARDTVVTQPPPGRQPAHAVSPPRTPATDARMPSVCPRCRCTAFTDAPWSISTDAA